MPASGADGAVFARHTRPPADPADQAIGPLGGDTERRGFIDQGIEGARVEPAEPLERKCRQALERLLGLLGQCPIVPRRALGELRCDCPCVMISSQAVFSAVTWAFFIQRWRSSSARASM